MPAGGVALFSFSLSEKMPVANLCLVFFLLVLFLFFLHFLAVSREFLDPVL